MNTTPLFFESLVSCPLLIFNIIVVKATFLLPLKISNSQCMQNKTSLQLEPTYCNSDYRQCACEDAALHTVPLCHLQ